MSTEESKVSMIREISDITIYFGWLLAEIVYLRTNSDKRIMSPNDIFFISIFPVNIKYTDTAMMRI